jgi:hypothetical protein
VINPSQNEEHELEAPSKIFPPTTQTLKNKPTSQLGAISVIFNSRAFLTKLNGVLTQNCKTKFLYAIQCLHVVQNHNLHEAQNTLKNAPYTLFFNKIYYFALLIKESVLMINHLDNWATINCSSQGRKQLVELYIKEIQPNISKASLSALIDIFFYYSTKDEFVTCIKKLQTFTGYQSRKVKEILQELERLNFILKRREKYFSSEESLVIQLINIEPLSNFLREKPLQLLATYVKTETLYSKGLTFKFALFNNVHDLENIVTIKTDRIPYDDETSYFLKQLNAGDIISYTPSVTRPTIKGVKHPLNLKIHSKAETEDDMTFFAKFEEIEVQTHERFEPTNRVRFSDIYNVAQTIYIKHTWQDLKPECLNSKALESLNLEQGDCLCFKARVKKKDEGKYFLSNINNIMPIEAFYNNQYGAM